MLLTVILFGVVAFLDLVSAAGNTSVALNGSATSRCYSNFTCCGGMACKLNETNCSSTCGVKNIRTSCDLPNDFKGCYSLQCQIVGIGCGSGNSSTNSACNMTCIITNTNGTRSSSFPCSCSASVEVKDTRSSTTTEVPHSERTTLGTEPSTFPTIRVFRTTNSPTIFGPTGDVPYNYKRNSTGTSTLVRLGLFILVVIVLCLLASCVTRARAARRSMTRRNFTRQRAASRRSIDNGGFDGAEEARARERDTSRRLSEQSGRAMSVIAEGPPPYDFAVGNSQIFSAVRGGLPKPMPPAYESVIAESAQEGLPSYEEATKDLEGSSSSVTR